MEFWVKSYGNTLMARGYMCDNPNCQYYTSRSGMPTSRMVINGDRHYCSNKCAEECASVKPTPKKVVPKKVTPKAKSAITSRVRGLVRKETPAPAPQPSPLEQEGFTRVWQSD